VTARRSDPAGPIARKSVASGLAFLLATAGGVAARAAELTYDLWIERGRVSQEMRLIRVKQGDLVRLRWRSDRPAILHLHGYDIEATVEPGAIAETAFTARATGRFPVHLHARNERSGSHSHDESPLVRIEVYPR
jgi:hypothetical protein